MIEYSVIIRTTGKAGEKYQKLLQSISKLQPQPQEVIVVLPEGYTLPEDQLGWETFYHCPKGMVTQRLYGLQQCKTPYALFSDDDIAFAPDFIKKLAAPVVSGEYGFSAGPLLNFFPPKGLPTICSALTGSAVPTIWHKQQYNHVLHTTGYSFNRQIKVGSGTWYETQSVAWTCFFADISKFRNIHFEDELWLDRNGYSAHDDTAMFYKAWLCGVKSVIVSDAIYDHLDGKTSTRGNHETTYYAIGFNDVVFWHRFLSGTHGMEKLWSALCIRYFFLMQKGYYLLNCLRHRMTKEENKAFAKGVDAGWKWLTSEEYKSLPKVVSKRS